MQRCMLHWIRSQAFRGTIGVRTVRRFLERVRRAQSSIIYWHSILVTPVPFTSMCICSRLLQSLNKLCRMPIGSNRLCPEKATWYTCPRIFTSALDSTRRPSPAMSDQWPRIDSFLNNGTTTLSCRGHLSPFSADTQPACKVRAVICGDAPRQLRALVPASTCTYWFAQYVGHESAPATPSLYLACAGDLRQMAGSSCGAHSADGPRVLEYRVALLPQLAHSPDSVSLTKRKMSWRSQQLHAIQL